MERCVGLALAVSQSGRQQGSEEGVGAHFLPPFPSPLPGRS